MTTAAVPVVFVIDDDDLIRAAIKAKLKEWRQANDEDLLRRDLELARA